MGTSFVILAAGRGTRLGGAVPKPLTVLEDGRTILQQQLANLTDAFGGAALAKTFVVVGHRASMIRSSLPEAVHTVLNSDYFVTNTSKSLARALEVVPKEDGVVWLNGDVVFDAEILKRAQRLIDSEQSFAVVDSQSTGEEEVKYRLNGEGFIEEISKTVSSPQGEAVGINYVSVRDRPIFLRALQGVAPEDYFEAAMERSSLSGVGWGSLSVGNSYAVEVDFPEDLLRANEVQSQS